MFQLGRGRLRGKGRSQSSRQDWCFTQTKSQLWTLIPIVLMVAWEMHHPIVNHIIALVFVGGHSTTAGRAVGAHVSGDKFWFHLVILKLLSNKKTGTWRYLALHCGQMALPRSPAS